MNSSLTDLVVNFVFQLNCQMYLGNMFMFPTFRVKNRYPNFIESVWKSDKKLFLTTYLNCMFKHEASKSPD